MDISAAKANMPKNPANGNPQTWANVIDNVLSRLEPSASGAGRRLVGGGFYDLMVGDGAEELADYVLNTVAALRAANYDVSVFDELVAKIYNASYTAINDIDWYDSPESKGAMSGYDRGQRKLKIAREFFQAALNTIRDIVPDTEAIDYLKDNLQKLLDDAKQHTEDKYGSEKKQTSSSNVSSSNVSSSNVSSSNVAAAAPEEEEEEEEEEEDEEFEMTDSPLFAKQRSRMDQEGKVLAETAASPLPRTPTKKQFAPTKPSGKGRKGKGRSKPTLLSIGPSSQSGKKFTVRLDIGGRKKTVHFGAKGANDFTLTGDKKARKAYLTRHKARENWTKSGIATPGFWARWILWEKPTVQASVAAVKKRFGL
jgi:hypothetical protein